jgi:hypothetical protein
MRSPTQEIRSYFPADDVDDLHRRPGADHGSVNLVLMGAHWRGRGSGSCAIRHGPRWQAAALLYSRRLRRNPEPDPAMTAKPVPPEQPSLWLLGAAVALVPILIWIAALLCVGIGRLLGIGK